MKTGPFKLRSGNKPSIAKLSGISPVKKIVGGGTGPSTHGKSKYRYSDPFYKDRAVRDDRGNTARTRSRRGSEQKTPRDL